MPDDYLPEVRPQYEALPYPPEIPRKSGSGDGTIYLAEQSRGFGADLVHVDFSAPSLAVAQARARTPPRGDRCRGPG